MYLLLDSTKREKIYIAIVFHAKKIKAYRKKVTFHESEKLLLLLQEIFHKHKKTLRALKGIMVVLGPGESFTSLRNSVVITNALAWSLNIPNVGIRKSEGEDDIEELIHKGLSLLKKRKIPQILRPFYGKKPNITKKKG